MKLEAKRVEEREKWVQSIVTALWDELEAGKREAALLAESVLHPTGHDLPPPLPSTSLAVVDATQTVELPPAPVSSSSPSLERPTTKGWLEEVQHLHKTLDMVEQRVKTIRESLGVFEGLNSLD